MIVWEFTNNSK